jgi:hypothetical protein
MATGGPLPFLGIMAGFVERVFPIRIQIDAEKERLRLSE